MYNTLSVIIPCYNEKNTIETIIDAVKSSPISLKKEIIVIDDASTDATIEILHNIEGIQLIKLTKNKGKGHAIRKGINAATGDLIIIQDADLEYSPIDYPNLVRPFIENNADIVYGSRFLKSDQRQIFGFWHYLANKTLTTLSNMFTNLNLTDMETCYKVFRADIIKSIPLKQNRFGFEPEITAKIAKKNLNIFEVSIGYTFRTHSEGKKITWKDGVVAVYCILRYSLF